MNQKSTEKDLFGKPKRKRRTSLEVGLERYDKNSFNERLERLRIVDKLIPKNYMMTLPPESFYVFQEAKDSFISGQFVATLMLSAAFVEHILTIALNEKGFEKESKRGMRSILKCLKKNGSALTPIISKIDHLQEIRNPFVHLKPYAHESTISQRLTRLKKTDMELLEEDAKDALSIMYTVAFTRVW